MAVFLRTLMFLIAAVEDKMGDFFIIINLQNSQWNSKEELSFCLNIGVALTEKLADKGVTVNCLHPGVVKTKIGNKAGNKLFGFIWSLFSSFGLNIDKGAATSIHLASSNEVAGVSGMYFDKCLAYKGSELSRDLTLQKSFWEWSEEKSKLKWEF